MIAADHVKEQRLEKISYACKKLEKKFSEI